MTPRSRGITILSQHFHPESVATGQLLTELGQELVARGLDVNVVCGQPTHDQIGRVPARIDHAGMVIRRVRNTQRDKNTAFGRVLNSATFALGVLRLLFAAPRKRKLLIVTNPPFLIWIGLLMRRLRRQRFAALIHDVYPDIAVKLGYLRPNSLLTRLWERLNRASYRAADAVIVLGRDMRDELAKKDIPAEKIHIVENWFAGDLTRPVPREANPFVREHSLGNKFIVMYSGNMGLAHDMESIIEAARRLRQQDQIHFVFIGGGGKLDSAKALAEKHALANVRFLPYQDRELLRYTLPAADVALISLGAGIEGLSVPSKLYGILAAGTPVVANLDRRSEVARVIEDADCGRVVPPENSEGIAQAILEYHCDRKLARRHGENARREFERRYTLQHAVSKYANLLQ